MVGLSELLPGTALLRSVSYVLKPKTSFNTIFAALSNSHIVTNAAPGQLLLQLLIMAVVDATFSRGSLALDALPQW